MTGSALPRLPALVLLVALAAGCDPLIEAQNPAAAENPALAQGRPATPGPLVVPTAEPAPSTEVATPLPKPVPTATAVITPVPPSTSPSVPASDASATPSPAPSGSQGPYQTTGGAGDLAISGDGYFVLSTKANPVSTEDLLFTRYGRFVLQSETVGTLPVYQLRHADYGFHVVGFTLAVGPEAGAPLETSGETQVVLGTTWSGSPLTAAGLFVDGDRNPSATSKLSFDYTGRLLISGTAPRGTDGGPNQVYIAITQFEKPDGLTPAPGFAGILRYDEAAGRATTGVAVTSAGREVGNSTLVMTGQLEKP